MKCTLLKTAKHDTSPIELQTHKEQHGEAMV